MQWIVSDPDEYPEIVVNEVYAVAHLCDVDVEAWVEHDQVIIESFDPVYRVVEVLNQIGEDYARRQQ